GFLQVLDQTRLPEEVTSIECRTAEAVWEAIRQLRVRGAPAIGIAGAYGVCLGVAPLDLTDAATRAASLLAVCEYLGGSRPTAVNLFWALERMRARAADVPPQATPTAVRQALLAEAQAIHAEDRAVCHQIGAHGAELL